METQVAADRLFEILDLESERNTGTIDLSEIDPLDIFLDKVSFAYPGRLPVLKEVSAKFRPSEITLLRGESGCGKSSLLSLLQRFHSPASGNIDRTPKDKREAI
jgi:ATP-binding cassette, subfamily C, bacteriocin exporter